MAPSSIITFRLPQDIESQAREAAERDHRSLSSWIALAVREKLSRKEARERKALPRRQEKKS